MKTLCYAFDWKNIGARLALAVLENLFPCFVFYNDVDEDTFEVSITCRQEDAAAIEKKLAIYM